MTDDQFELASAYLDGAVTDEERARVDGDAELLALVRELRSISTAVSDAPPASATAREAAVAAALAAFDQVSGGAPTEQMPATPPAPVDIPPAPSLAGVDESSVAPADDIVVPLVPRRRFRFGHAISVAAAAVVVLAGGVALFRDNAEAPTNDEATFRQSIAPLPTDLDASAGAPPTTTAALPPSAAATEAAEATTAAAAVEPDEALDDPPAETRNEPGAVDAEGAEPDDPDDRPTVPQLPAAPRPSTTVAAPPVTHGAVPPPAAGPATTSPSAAELAPTGAPLTSEAAASATSDAATTVDAAGDPAAAGAEPAPLTSREEFATFAATLAEPETILAEGTVDSSAQYSPTTAPDAASRPELLPFDQAITRCRTPGSDPLRSDATYVDEDDTEHPVAVVIISDDGVSPVYGGVDVVSCALVVDTAEPSLVTTTVADTATVTITTGG